MARRSPANREALGGVAAHAEGLACVKVEELLDVSQEGWTFAHEFAHLAERALSPAAQQELEALSETACATSYAFHSYQLRNPHELFAVAYTDFLLLRSELRLDDEGAMKAVLDFVENSRQQRPSRTVRYRRTPG